MYLYKFFCIYVYVCISIHAGSVSVNIFKIYFEATFFITAAICCCAVGKMYNAASSWQ